jgi:endonuclease/exonuclease/phosphatase family metal-dependent hydrolase
MVLPTAPFTVLIKAMTFNGIFKHVVKSLIMAVFGAVLTVSQNSMAETDSRLSFLSKQSDPFQLRVMSWNVWRNSIFKTGEKRQESFERIIRAVQPDVICLQEVAAAKAGDLSELMDRLLPLEGSQHWHVHSASNTDLIIASRYPLRRREYEYVIPVKAIHPDFHLGQIMCMVDLPDSRILPDLYLMTAHFLSGPNLEARQKQADSIVSKLRHLRQKNHPDTLPAGTPIIILGDLNVYSSTPDDPTQHLSTLLTGNIVDEAEFGADLLPDWDGTYLAEVKPRHNSREKAWYTWRDDNKQFAPGALDRVIYTDSVLGVQNSFVLNTTAMSSSELNQSGLLAEDVLRSAKPGDFDHLPLVTDFVFKQHLLGQE